jgi:cytochrome c oxidase cbb3-type subunit 3
MGNFSEGFWNLFLVVVTLGSIGAMALLVKMLTKGKTASSTEETTGHVWDEDLRELNNPLPAWWRNMFYITLIFGVIYLLLYPGLGTNAMFLGWTQIGQYEEEMAEAEAKYGPLFDRFLNEPIESLAGNPEALKMGERLYASYCTQCHGSDAGGVRGYPNLRDGDWLWGGTPDRIEESILKGRQAAMPAWGDALKEDGVKDMTQYVLSLAGREHDAAAAERGKTKYTVCLACHGPEGKGNPALGAANLTDDVWLYGGSPKAIEATIRGGRNGIMPAHEEFLGAAKVHLLSAYVYSLSRSK